MHPFDSNEDEALYLGNVYHGDFENFFTEFETSKYNPESRQADILSEVEYLKVCAAAIESMNRGDLEKVVLHSVKEMEVKNDPTEIFLKALNMYPDALVHWTYISGTLNWMGASPELLLKRKSSGCETMSLAGTREQEGPKMKAKEEREQEIVTISIKESLQNLGVHDVAVSERFEKRSGHLVHFCNTIRFNTQLDDDLILEALHPTPAVSGFPKKKAFEYLKNLGMADRRYYCGYIGSRAGNRSEYYVNLRCMSLGKEKAMIYVGGGVTKDSVPEAEWEEMNQKARIMGALLI